jgi:hypothetical protein
MMQFATLAAFIAAFAAGASAHMEVVDRAYLLTFTTSWF